MKLVLASRNAKKLRELKEILSGYFPDVDILSPEDIGLYEEIEENGETFEENALIKARAVAEKSGLIGVGDDSGLTVDALGGEPGIYSARYAAIKHYAGGHDDKANNRLLLENLEQVPEQARGGAFVCAIACVLPSGESFCVRGEVRGRILRDYRGESGFGYDPLFYYEPFGKSFAELTAEEKNSVSHRGRALAALAQRIKELELQETV